jgi:hypothetical protein
MTADSLVEPVAEPPATGRMHIPRSPDEHPELARRNAVLALMLWALSLALFVGTIGIAFVYLALD